jgi:hypothetical protein
MASTSRFCAFLLFLMLVSHAAPADAQIVSTRPYATLFIIDAESPAASVEPTMRAAVQDLGAIVGNVTIRAVRPPDRVATAAMYGGFVTLQALDAHSTLRAIDAGLTEANPLMRWATDHPVAFVSMKAGATMATLLVSEKIRKKHPKRALIFMAAINATYAFVVAHNYRAPGRVR